ncbi:MAG: AraC family transcriptional regulator ligand-binding domain-containing protein [Porticoccaceae bacterium]
MEKQENSGAMDVPSVPLNYSRLVAREIGIGEKQLPRLLAGTDIAVEAFMRDDFLLTPRQQVRIARNAFELSADPSLGLRLGRLLTPESYGPLGFLACACATLGEAIEQFRLFLPSRIPLARLTTREEGGWLRCHIEVRYTTDSAVRRAAVECISLSLLGLVETIMGSAEVHGYLECSYPQPDYGAAYARYLPVPVSFGAADDCLCLAAALSGAVNPSASRANYAFALRQCQEMAAALATTDMSFRERVFQVLLAAPPGTLSAERVADSLFVSRRTLIRRLAAEGTSYRELVDALRSRIAARHLLDTADTVESIAVLLNYHDSASFRRAFRRWHGVAPDVFRRTKKARRETG